MEAKCFVATLVGPARERRKVDVLADSGRYAAVLRPEDEAQRVLLYGQPDVCVFAEASEDGVVAVDEAELSRRDKEIEALRALNRRLAQELQEAREALERERSAAATATATTTPK